MGRSIKEAMQIAFEDKGLEIPKRGGKLTPETKHELPKQPKASHGEIYSKPNSPTLNDISSSAFTSHKKAASSQGKAMFSTQGSRGKTGKLGNGSVNPSRHSRNLSQPKVTPIVKATPIPPWEISISQSAKLTDVLKKTNSGRAVIPLKQSGIAEQFNGALNAKETREVVVGIDFGTSSVKVVIGDRSAEHAFAVPFCDADGIDRYLLPSHLWLDADGYSLEHGDEHFRDLKLSLLKHDVSELNIIRAVAFLALVIRYARGWFFSTHEDIYRNTKIAWKLVLGMPAENYENQQLVDRFLSISRASWIVAGIRSKHITNELARAALLPKSDGEGCIEVEVVPELSAQIYGFLKSNKFDKNAPNYFVMADVGAGTVDSALFHVKKLGGRWHFEFYTNHVQPFGVMNLHRARVDWLIKAIKSKGQETSTLIDELHSVEMPTDQLDGIPETLEEYILGGGIKFSDIKHHPDEEFFIKKVTSQVRGKTIWRTWKEGHLDQSQLTDIPTILCGGGMRMKYYQRLIPELKKFDGCTWLKTKSTEMEIPKELKAPGLIRSEFDRLSVAYGLSFMDVGRIVKAIPPPVAKSDQGQKHQYTDSFVSKDLV